MKHVLIAEDEIAIRRLMTSVLERSGFSVTAVSNGAEAIRAIQRGNDFDVAVLDLMMPVVNGFKVLEVVRAEQPELPCIVVTAAGEVGLGMLPAGTTVMKKPFDPEQLVQILNTLTGAVIEPPQA